MTLALAVLLASAEAAQGSSDCPDGTRLVEERRVETATAIYIQPICEAVEAPKPPTPPPLYAPGFDSEVDFIDGAISQARSEGWSDAEIGRLSKALADSRDFQEKGDKTAIQVVWDAMEKRGSDPALARSAISAQGARLLASGWQSGKYSDCVLFAIATSSGQPYGVVAARANALIAAAKWRNQAYRRDPQRTFSEGGGLNDYEVAFLAEAFGQVATVQPPAYAAAIRSGRVIVLPVTTRGGTGHEVVLARTFRHAGSDWFEVIDSTQNQPLYLSQAELSSIALAKGLILNAGPGEPVPYLRAREEK